MALTVFIRMDVATIDPNFMASFFLNQIEKRSVAMSWNKDEVAFSFCVENPV